MNKLASKSSLKKFLTVLTQSKAIFLIIFTGVLVYSNSIFNGFVGDDDQQILNNPAVHTLTNIPRLFTESTFYTGAVTSGGLYYKPILSTVFTVLYVLFGAHALGFHVFQLFLHLANVILIFLILESFFDPFVALALSLGFLVHPINAETVSYISALQDTLFFFFGSFALLLQIKLQKTPLKLFVVSLFLLLSLFSKETGILFVTAVILYQLIIKRKDMLSTGITGAIAITIYGIFRIGLAHILFNTTSGVAIMKAPILVRWTSVPSVILYYLRNTFFPTDHAILQTGLMIPINTSNLLTLLVIIGAIFSFIAWIGSLVYRKYKKYFPIYFFFTLLFIIGLLFHSQFFFPLDYIVADRWFYFPFFGLLGMFGVLYEITKPKFEKISRSYRVITIILIITGLSVLTILHNMLFSNNLVLLSHDILLEPDSGTISGLLGTVLMQNGQYKKAEPYLQKAKELNPLNPAVWDELGTYYYLTNQQQKANAAFSSAIAVGNDYQSYQNYAIFLFLYEGPGKAENVTKDGLEKFPTNGILWQIYALIENSLGQTTNALHAAKQALLYNPTTLTKDIYDRLSKNLPVTSRVYLSGTHRVLQVCPPDCGSSTTQNSITNKSQTVDNTFSSNTMHVLFSYPKNLKLTQVNPQVVSITSSLDVTNKNALFVYSLTVPNNSTTIPLPFSVSGTLQTETPIAISGFNANLLKYSDGQTESDILLLRQHQQIFIIKIPQNSKLVSDAITDIINSIQLH